MKSFSNIVKLHAIVCKQVTVILAIIVFITGSLNAAQVNTNIKTFTISGNVGLAGVRMNGLPGDPITNVDGYYLVRVEYGWSGKIQPVKEGYLFTPPIKIYSNVSGDMTNQNYKAQVQMLTISDIVEFEKNKPVSGVNIIANPGNIKTVTDSKGQYSIQVPYGWSGEILLSKSGFVFRPEKKSYENVTTDIINGIPVPPTNIMDPPMGGAMGAAMGYWSKTSGTVGRRILYVPSGDIDSKDIAETREDILVMAEILDERFREPRLIGGVLTDFGDFFGRDNQQTEAIYMQGYGLVFMMEVNYQFSLLSQPGKEVEPQTNSDKDQTWENARQRVLSVNTEKQVGEYDKQMVEILKTELIRTLKYASNVRNIKPDEWVILSVSGGNRQSIPLGGGMMGGLNIGGMMGGGYGGGTMAGSYGGGMMGGGYSGGMVVGGSYGYGGGGFSSYSHDGNTIIGGYEYSSPVLMNNTVRNNQNISPTVSVMTIRVKRSDVEEYANEKIDFGQFRQKVQILLY